MKKTAILLFVITLTMLTACFKMTVKQLAQEAAGMNKECPIDIEDIGRIVHVSSEDSILVFQLQLYPFRDISSEEEDSTTLLREDSLVNRYEDAKLFIGAIFFKPHARKSADQLEWIQNIGEIDPNNTYDPLVNMGGKIRVDIIRQDSSLITSILYSSQDILDQSLLCYQRAKKDSLALDAILEFEIAISKLKMPFDHQMVQKPHTMRRM